MKADTRSFYEQAVQDAIRCVAGHLDDALDLEALARGAGLSAFHFHRVFRGMTGETPLELSRRLRLERAAWQLARSGRPVTDIAFDAGYESHEAFTRAFRARYDNSPSGFRASDGHRFELAAACGIHFDPDGSVGAFIARDSGGRQMHVDIRTVPALRLATVRHIGPYNQIGRAFARLGQTLGPLGERLRQERSAMIALYHDDPDSVPADQLRSDAGVTVPENIALPAGLVEQRIPAGPVASTIHVGPYETLGDAWARLMGEWLPSSGQRIGAGPSYEIYLNDPSTTPPAELRTELRVPLA